MSNVRIKDDGLTFHADIYGYDQLKRLMKQIDPDIRKRMDREIRSTIKPVVVSAQGHVPDRPMSNWGSWTVKRKSKSGEETTRDLSFDAGKVRRGIAIRQGGKRSRGSIYKSAWRIMNRDAAGAIYEVAGRKGSGETPQGRAFVANLNKRGKASRLIWAAWERKGGERTVTRNIAETIQRYESELQARIR